MMTIWPIIPRSLKANCESLGTGKSEEAEEGGTGRHFSPLGPLDAARCDVSLQLGFHAVFFGSGPKFALFKSVFDIQHGFFNSDTVADHLKM